MSKSPSTLISEIARLAQEGPLDELLDLLQHTSIDLSEVQLPLAYHVVRHLSAHRHHLGADDHLDIDSLRRWLAASHEACNAALNPLIVPVVARLIELGASTVLSEDDHLDIFDIAFQFRNEALLAVLLDAGVDPNRTTRSGETLLHIACAEGNTALVTLLLRHGANPNGSGAHRASPLHYACQRGNLEMVIQLVKSGARLNAKEPIEVDTPLIWACAAGHKHVVDWLLDVCPGDVIQQQNAQGWTALAISLTYDYPDITRCLLEAEVAIDGFETRTHVLESLADNRQNIPSWDDKLALVLEYIEDINEQDIHGMTVLMMVVTTNDVDLIQALLDHGANPLHRDAAGMTAADHARAANAPEVADRLEQAALKLFSPGASQTPQNLNASTD